MSVPLFPYLGGWGELWALLTQGKMVPRDQEGKGGESSCTIQLGRHGIVPLERNSSEFGS